MVGVLLDDREQVAEQLLLRLSQLGVVDGDRMGRIGQQIDRRAAIVLDGLRFGRRDRRRSGDVVRRARLPGARTGAAVSPRAHGSPRPRAEVSRLAVGLRCSGIAFRPRIAWRRP